jgi:parvulin-like peptidyl-prolyl isomerase
MSKREQTTGIPKENPQRRADTPPSEPGKKPPRPLSKRQEYRSRAEREAEIQRYVILGTSIAVAVVAIILVIALVVDQIIIPNQVVATVEGQNITIGDFQKRVRLERLFHIQQLENVIAYYRNFFGATDEQIGQLITTEEPFRTYYNELQIPDQMGLSVINDVVEDQLIRNAAAERGITVTEEDVQAQITRFLENYGLVPPEAESAPEATAEVTATVEPTATPTPYVSPTPSPTPTITPTPEFTPTPTNTPLPTVAPEPTLTGTQQAEEYTTTRNNFLAQVRSQAGLSDADIHRYFETLAIRRALRDDVASDITETGPFADVRHILVATEEEAQDVLAALQAGESFADLAKAVSTDTSNASQGGELGWAPVTQYVKPFQDAVLSAEIGEFVGPVQTEFGYHILQVRGREDRELTEDQITQAKEAAFAVWLDELKAAKAEQTQTFSNWVDHVPNTPASPFG